MGRLWLILMAALFAALGAMPAAAEVVPSRSCVSLPAASGAGWGPWHCGEQRWSGMPAQVRLRREVAPGSAEPRYLVTRLGRFEDITLTAIARDGSRAAVHLSEDRFSAAPGGWRMRVPLPGLSAPLAAVELTVTGVRHSGLMSDVALETDTALDSGTLGTMLFIAILTGLLCAPLLYNLLFWRVLRQRFLVWHTLAAICAASMSLVTTGLITLMVDLPVHTLSLVANLSIGALAVFALLFAGDLLEEGMLDAHHRRWLKAMAGWTAAATALFLAAPGWAATWASPLFYASFLPVIATLLGTMWIAWRRGSRVVRYQLAAWLPMMLVSLARIVSMLGATAVAYDFYLAQIVALAAAVLVTGFAVVDRFMALRRERDQALLNTAALEVEIDRDPLTGLLNRRALEARFETYYRQGFRTLAVIDLDRFKDINDRFGHAVGDRVLVAVASALAPDHDTHAVRMGGEEFLLLLRGNDAAARAEQRRNAIALRIAGEVEGLDRVVTASMGLIEQVGGAVHAGFEAAYAHGDRLLYEAKRSGRNRMVAERLQTFQERRKRDRRAAA